jgi:hypothetical protein
MSSVSSTSSAVAQATSDFVPATSENEGSVSCMRLVEDAAQTTLMLIEIQRWYDLHSNFVK